MNLKRILLLFVASSSCLAGTHSSAGESSGSANREACGAPASVWSEIESKAASQPTGSAANESKFLEMRRSARDYYETYRQWKAPEPPAPPPGHLRNLSDVPTQPRFPLTGRDWPQKAGDASVCLWEDDKIAAMSLLLWGSVPSALSAAQSLAEKYPDIRFSGSLITGFIDHPSLHPGVKENQSLPGAWDPFRSSFSQGIHFLSQSMTWNVDPVFEDGWPGPEWECAESIRLIDANIPGHKTRMLCSPGAYIAAFNLGKNWRPFVARHFMAQIGPLNGGINPANQTDYFNIKGIGCQKITPQRPDPTLDYAAYPAADNFHNLLDPDPKNPHHAYYRGWVLPNIHMLDADTSSPGSVLFGKVLDFYAKHRDEIWSGCADDVAMYGQERDTATLRTLEAGNDRVDLLLTCSLDPANFDYPLTIKVRLPTEWKTAAATQDGKTLPLKITAYEGAHYALVRIIPNRGVASIRPL